MGRGLPCQRTRVFLSQRQHLKPFKIIYNNNDVREGRYCRVMEEDGIYTPGDFRAELISLETPNTAIIVVTMLTILIVETILTTNKLQ